jgi:NADH dehydrogenase FAD-containing subunit
MAWPALHQATFVAKQITRTATNRPQQAFKPRSVPCGLPVGDNWGYVEWLGIYQPGRFGYILRRWMELYGYCQLVPFKVAVPVWRAHDLFEIDK